MIGAREQPVTVVTLDGKHFPLARGVPDAVAAQLRNLLGHRFHHGFLERVREYGAVLVQQKTKTVTGQFERQHFADDSIDEEVGGGNADGVATILDQRRNRDHQFLGSGIRVGFGNDDACFASQLGFLLPGAAGGIPVRGKVL